MELVIETLIYLGLVYFLWFIVAAEVTGSLRERLRLHPAARFGVNVLALAISVGLAIDGETIRIHEFGWASVKSTFVSLPYDAWALLIGLYYGRDMWRLLSRAHRG